MKDIVEIYKECGDFSKAVQLSGLPHLVAHIKLLQVSKEELKGILDMYVETLNMSKERTD